MRLNLGPRPMLTKLLLCVWFTYCTAGRVDDVINPSGHRIGTAEVESALVACPEVQ